MWLSSPSVALSLLSAFSSAACLHSCTNNTGKGQLPREITEKPQRISLCCWASSLLSGMLWGQLNRYNHFSGVWVVLQWLSYAGSKFHHIPKGLRRSVVRGARLARRATEGGHAPAPRGLGRAGFPRSRAPSPSARLRRPPAGLPSNPRSAAVPSLVKHQASGGISRALSLVKATTSRPRSPTVPPPGHRARHHRCATLWR